MIVQLLSEHSVGDVRHVRLQAYPHVLATGSMSDSRVGYWEPAKMIAKLRSTATSKNLLLLKVPLSAPHYGIKQCGDMLQGTDDCLPSPAVVES